MSDGIGWRCAWRLDKYRVTEKGLHVPDNGWRAAIAHLDLVDVIHGTGNVLTYGGASALWDRLVADTPTVGQFTQTGTVIGVGTSLTAAVASQTELQATNDSSNRHYLAQESGWPDHTDGTTETAASIEFKSSFGTTAANFAWREWGVGTGTAGAGGSGSFTRMLNRKVQSFGTKTSADTWNLTITVTIS